MAGKILFNIACTILILFSLLCLFGSINDGFSAISIILFIIMLCLWIPKINSVLIRKYFNDSKFLYFIIALFASFIMILFSFYFSIHNVANQNQNNKIESTEIKNEQILKNKSTEIKKEQKIKNKSKEDLTWFAKYQCEKEIKAKATYPPSVKVKFRNDNYINGNSYTMYGTVDSQNSFGAMVRQNFGCEIIIDQENDKFWIKDLLIE